MKKHQTLLSRTILSGRQERVPVWFMRQAGRYLPEYHELKKKQSNFMEFCKTPELCVEATLQPLRRFPLDAVIIFSDILVIPQILGQNVSFEEGKGLSLTSIDWKRLNEQFHLHQENDFETRAFLKEHLRSVYDICRMVRASLPSTPDAPECIGFAGAPWTLACYMIQGRGTHTFSDAVAYGYEYPETMDLLISLLSSFVSHHLILQAEAGAGVLQIFDSLAGVLPADGFERWCVKPLEKIISTLRKYHVEAPVIGFPRRGGFSLKDFCQRTRIHALSLTESACLSQVKKDLGSQESLLALQGNLHPAMLLREGEHLSKSIDFILTELKDFPHIFNLGHGILPETCYDAVARAVEQIQKY